MQHIDIWKRRTHTCDKWNQSDAICIRTFRMQQSTYVVNTQHMFVVEKDFMRSGEPFFVFFSSSSFTLSSLLVFRMWFSVLYIHFQHIFGRSMRLVVMCQWCGTWNTWKHGAHFRALQSSQRFCIHFMYAYKILLSFL